MAVAVGVGVPLGVLVCAGGTVWEYVGVTVGVASDTTVLVDVRVAIAVGVIIP